ncbi:hypothetical protein HGQ17_07505 [Nesterenkonia sp. MY13]|uniref:Uncharacterized protein n=1 Tax=Nesterenkonia sedimenti TaxID=1463632 RepID=A0A7X8YDY6_9MICC|nr:hypothetical protein [Nesterenkonia sedimenti]NLS09851.1 hypothetical protein [Nesterenkonia sedimenti]
MHFILGEPGVDWISGEFYGSNRRLARTARAAGNPEIVNRHWQLSAEVLDLEARPGLMQERVTGWVSCSGR